MDQYDHMKAVRKIQDFVIEDMSNWYIRRARRRFWAEELDEDKKSVYATTYEVMVGLVPADRSVCSVYFRGNLSEPDRKRIRAPFLLP